MGEIVAFEFGCHWTSRVCVCFHLMCLYSCAGVITLHSVRTFDKVTRIFYKRYSVYLPSCELMMLHAAADGRGQLICCFFLLFKVIRILIEQHRGVSIIMVTGSSRRKRCRNWRSSRTSVRYGARDGSAGIVRILYKLISYPQPSFSWVYISINEHPIYVHLQHFSVSDSSPWPKSEILFPKNPSENV